MKIGRNAPCPCGSGKKYKRCCMRAENFRVAGTAWRRMRRTEGRLVPALDYHAMEYYGPDAALDAWDEFTLWEDVPMVEEEPWPEVSTIFRDWFHYNWVPDNSEIDGMDHLPEMPVAMHYLQRGAGRTADKFTRRFVEEACSQEFSFFMVTAVERGRRMTIKDLLCKREFTVHERRGSQILRKGEIVYARVVTLDGESIMLGCAPYAIPPSYAEVFFDLRDSVTAEELQGTKLLREWDFELREIYFDIRDRLLNPELPDLRNTDGEPLQPTQLHYDLSCTPGEARDALAPLALGSPDRYAESAPEVDGKGQLVAMTFPWLKKGNRRNKSWSNTTLGRIAIHGAKLTAEVNSEKRAEALKREMKKRLGGKARFRRAVLTSLEKMFEDLRANPDGAAARRQSEHERRTRELKANPELRHVIEQHANEHWRAWLDEALPALDGRTPREAAQTESGRERLEALLLEFEYRCSGQAFDPDVDALRNELGVA